MPRLSVRVPSELKDQLDADDNLNVSGLLRSLLESYLLAGDAIEVGLERRKKDKEQELERKRLKMASLESEIESIQREIDSIEDKIKERRQSTPEEVVEFATLVENGNFDRDSLAPDNLAVEEKADKAGVHVEQFIDMVEERLE